jgi:hypothetical protein
MKPERAIPLLRAIVRRERNDGCPLADESLIQPALRRWQTYERRFRNHKDKSLRHRAQDLENAFLDSLADYECDSG